MQEILEAGIEVKVSGPLDNKGAAKLRHTLLNNIRSGNTNIFLDVRDVPYINSDGLKMLMSVRDDRPNVNISIRNANTHVLRTFELTNLDEVFNVTGHGFEIKVEAA